jgi:hypothetical protein
MERAMTSRDRIKASWEGKSSDHTPLTTWCFGFKPPPELTWEKNGKPVDYWYSLRMEHIHTLPQPWELDDDFKRVIAWQLVGVDDVLDISIPWSIDPEVTWEDTVVPPASAGGDSQHPVMVREYHTPSGALTHAVKRTGEQQGNGWVVQPEQVPLFEDFNIPRGFQHAVSSTADIPEIRHLYCPPDETARRWFKERMERIADFTKELGVATQAWAAFGMDGIVWLTGAEGAVLMAMDHPKEFGKLVDIVAESDYERSALACTSHAVDMIVQRGWYSSTDFWSPRLFDEYVYPHVLRLADLAHRHGKKFGYTMTTGVELLGARLVDAGVDVLYFIDPIQDTITLEKGRELFGKDLTLVGGTNSVSLASGDHKRIREQVSRAIEVLGPTDRFILHPVDAIFPDTPWESVEVMIETWKKTR